uniref:Uncharacterized protein n=1 Tax=Anguilla anguilla TaxID=7936 RepID=A0A0E9QME9_ANGAN
MFERRFLALFLILKIYCIKYLVSCQLHKADLTSSNVTGRL